MVVIDPHAGCGAELERRRLARVERRLGTPDQYISRTQPDAAPRDVD